MTEEEAQQILDALQQQEKNFRRTYKRNKMELNSKF